MNLLQPCADMPRERLFEYSSKMLDESQARRVEAHIRQCARCRSAIASFEALDRVLEEWKPVEPSPWFDARTRAHVTARMTARLRPWFLAAGWKSWVGVAAVILLIVGTSLIALHRPAGRGAGAQPEMTAKLPQTSVPPAASVMSRPRPEDVAEARQGIAAAPAAPAESASQEMDLYEHLKVLENYDMLAHFDVLSELPRAGDKASD